MEFASIIKEYSGAIGIIILVLCLAMVLLKQLLSVVKATNESISSLRKDNARNLEKQEERDHLQDLDIQFIKDNYARKEDIYRELGGWKAELSRLDEHIEHNQKEQNKQLIKIMELLVKEKQQ